MQQLPGVPEAGATPGAPVELLTQSWLAPHATFTSFLPHPSGRFVPHWPAYDAAVFGVQQEPVDPFEGGGVSPPDCVHVWPAAQPQLTEVPPQPSESPVPHLPGYVPEQVKSLQHVFVDWLQMPLGQEPQVTVPPHSSLKVPHWSVAKFTHDLGVQGGPHTPFALQTLPLVHWPQEIVLPVQTLVTLPQFSPSATHSTGVTAGSHWLASPATPQLSPLGQPSPGTASQLTVPPQPFVMAPHWAPAAAQSVAAVPGVQLGSHRLNAALQTSVPLHVPQSVKFDETSGPQPSHAKPHWKPRSRHATGWHVSHWFVSVLHCCPAAHPLVFPSGQSMKAPQLVMTVPHWAFSSAQVVSTGPHVFVARLHTCATAVPPSAFVAGAQPPHCVTVPLHESNTGPHFPVQRRLTPASLTPASGQAAASGTATTTTSVPPPASGSVPSTVASVLASCLVPESAG